LISPHLRHSGVLSAVSVLPDQSTSDSSRVNFIATYIWDTGDGGGFLITQSFRAIIDGSDVSLVNITTMQLISFLNGYDENSNTRVVSAGQFVWINAGSSLQRYTRQGFYADVEIYPTFSQELSDVDSVSIIDMAASPDGEWLALLSTISFTSSRETETFWTLHDGSNPAVINEIVGFDSLFPNLELSFTPDSDYAVANDPDPASSDRFYIINLSSIGKRLRLAAQSTWGRAVFVDDPVRLVVAMPTSFDSFVSYENNMSVVPFSEILAEAEIVP